MNDLTRVHLLRYALIFVGLLFTAIVYPFIMSWWPSAGHMELDQTEQMLLSVYATLGIFLLLAARKPLQNRSLIWFTVWSSVAHAGVMTVQAIHAPGERAHLLGGSGGLLIVAILLAVLTPRGVVTEADNN